MMGWVKLDDGFSHHPKVIGLSLEARWAYIESLCYAAKYDTDGEIPDAVAAKGPERAELIAAGLWESLENSVSIHDYLVYNPSKAERNAKRIASSKAAGMRWALGDGTGTGVVDSRGESTRGGDQFDRFWAEYPRKVGKRKARLAFEQALRRAPAEEIVEGAGRFAADSNREDTFTPHPTTWLNRDGWEDAPLPARNGKPPDRAAEIATGAWRGGDRGTGASRSPGGPAPRSLPR